jgi:hypothetical protein
MRRRVQHKSISPRWLFFVHSDSNHRNNRANRVDTAHSPEAEKGCTTEAQVGERKKGHTEKHGRGLNVVDVMMEHTREEDAQMVGERQSSKRERERERELSNGTQTTAFHAIIRTLSSKHVTHLLLMLSPPITNEEDRKVEHAQSETANQVTRGNQRIVNKENSQ